MGGKVWKSFMAKLYGFGAAVVIVGAMFKIMHWPGAGPMLVAGLSTEAIIFFFSAFEPPHEEVDWSLVYPELAGMHGEEGALIEEKGSLTEQLDNLLEEAKIGPELIASLGTGLKQLSDQTGKLNNITDAGAASSEFANKIKTASQSVGNLSESYDKAKDTILSSAEEMAGSYNKAKDSILSSSEKLSQSYGNAVQALDALTNSNEQSQTIYGQELQKTSKNLFALNASYELHLQNSNEHLKTTADFYDGLSNLMKNLNDSVDDTKKYKEQISQLSVNLESLNTIYGNMLTAMRK
jgi:gliding motility-associated protein GldL